MNVGDRKGCCVVIEKDVLVFKGGQNNKCLKLKCDCGKEKFLTIPQLGRAECRFCSQGCPFRKKPIVLTIKEEEFLVKKGEKFGCWETTEDPIYVEKHHNGSKREYSYKTQVIRCKCICNKERYVECRSLLAGVSKCCGRCINRFTGYYKGTLYDEKTGKKKCNKCLKFKTKKCFSVKNRNIDGLRYSCKLCEAKQWLKLEYKLSPEDYQTMFDAQNGVCAICGEIERTKLGKKLAVDHCHKTGKIRGLLCFKCNRGLGIFKDSIELFNNAIKYLETTS